MVGLMGNQVLESTLTRLAWSAARLADEVNLVMGAGYTCRSTVADWVRGRVPRQPLPTVVAHLLESALGEPLVLERLWQGRARPCADWVRADDGLAVPWTVAGTVDVLTDWWVRGGSGMSLDRRNFLAVSGAAATGPAWSFVDTDTPGVRPLSLLGKGIGADDGTLRVTHGMVTALEEQVMSLRRMDDVEGGDSSNLRFAHRAFASVGEYLRNGSYPPGVGRRMLSVLAQLAQIVGWMAVDAEKHGLAQRYYRTGLHAAHSAADKAIGAHILGSMAQQAVDLAKPLDAVDIANAAMESAKAAPPSVRAITASRFGYAQAATGNHYGYRAAFDEARGHIANAVVSQDRPNYLYYLNAEELETQAGDALIHLAQSTSRGANPLYAEAIERLTVVEMPARDQLLADATCARAYVRMGELDQAARAGRKAVDALSGVRSERIRSLLRDLNADLATIPRPRQSSALSAFHRDLSTALSA